MKREEMRCNTCIKAALDAEVPDVAICRCNPIPLIIATPELIASLDKGFVNSRQWIEKHPADYWCASGAWRGPAQLVWSGKTELRTFFWTDHVEGEL